MSGKLTVEAKITLPLVIINSSIRPELALAVREATSLIVVKEYKEESPVNKGTLRNDVESERQSDLSYIVTTTATSKGFPYPVALHTGTKKLRGSADFGYTTGRVRAHEVAFGIGGIRPNKFATRAANKSTPHVRAFINVATAKAIRKQSTKRINA